jgi:dTDP-4-dehydrorhamnose reductase
LAERTAQLVERGIDGIVHLGGGAPISWFEWAVKIFKAANVNPPVKPTNEREFRTAARRPKYSALSNAKAEALGVTPMPPPEEALRLYMEARAKKIAPVGV